MYRVSLQLYCVRFTTYMHAYGTLVLHVSWSCQAFLIPYFSRSEDPYNMQVVCLLICIAYNLCFVHFVSMLIIW